MPITYSLVPRKEDLHDKDSKWKVYAAAQRHETVTLEKIAHHISSHNSVFSAGTIIGLLTDFEKCVVEQLKNGNRVDLGQLGAFFVTLRSRGASSTEEFSTNLIDHINVRWRCSKMMDDAMQSTPLCEVPNRAEQRKAKKEMIAKTNEAIETSKSRKA